MAKKLGEKAIFNRLDKALIEWCGSNGVNIDLIVCYGDTSTKEVHTWNYEKECGSPLKLRCNKLTGKVTINGT